MIDDIILTYRPDKRNEESLLFTNLKVVLMELMYLLLPLFLFSLAIIHWSLNRISSLNFERAIDPDSVGGELLGMRIILVTSIVISLQTLILSLTLLYHYLKDVIS